MSRSGMRFVVGVVIVALAAPVQAQPAGDAEAQARVLFQRGTQHFDLAEWDAAIADYKEAYRVFPDPLFLFNIAQAYRQQGECRQARTFYRTYLRNAPDAFNRDKVEKRIVEMETCIRQAGGDPSAPDPAADVGADASAAGDAGATTPPVADPSPGPGPTDGASSPSRSTGPVADAAVPPSVVEAPRPRGHDTRRTLGYASLGAGVALGATGLYFSSRASAAARDLEDACATSCDAESPTIRAIDDRGNTAERNATIGYVLGGAAFAAGVGLLVWSTVDHPPAEVAVVPSSRGAVVSASLRF